MTAERKDLSKLKRLKELGLVGAINDKHLTNNISVEAAKMDWINITEEKPDEFAEVLVATDLYDDGYLNYFIAIYWIEENEWIQHLHFPGDQSPYLRIYRKTLPNDKWRHIQ